MPSHLVDPNRKKKKRILTKLDIGEISAVNQPAQEGALMAILKSAGTSGMLKETEHPNADTLGKLKEKGAMPKTVEELTAELKKSAEDTKALQKAFDRTNAILSMPHDTKTHFDGMKKKAQDEFLKLDSDAQTEAAEEVRKNNEAADPVIYKSATGVEYRESESSLAALAKQSDTNAKDLRKAREDTDDLRLEKRVSQEIPNLKGTNKAKAALLKAVGDDEEALEMLKAADAAVSDLFKAKGTATGEDNDDDEDDPEAKLDELAKEEAKESKVTFEKAYATVITTPAGAKLYDEAVSH